MQALELPLVAQSLDYTCAAACFDSMFRFFHGHSPGEMHFAKELGTLELGYTPPENVFMLAQTHNFNVLLKEKQNLSVLKRHFAQGNVIFVTWWDEDAGHYSLVQAMEGETIILMDPWKAREDCFLALPLKEFLRNWNSRGAKMICVSPLHT